MYENPSKFLLRKWANEEFWRSEDEFRRYRKVFSTFSQMVFYNYSKNLTFLPLYEFRGDKIKGFFWKNWVILESHKKAWGCRTFLSFIRWDALSIHKGIQNPFIKFVSAIKANRIDKKEQTCKSYVMFLLNCKAFIWRIPQNVSFWIECDSSSLLGQDKLLLCSGKKLPGPNYISKQRQFPHASYTQYTSF